MRRSVIASALIALCFSFAGCHVGEDGQEGYDEVQQEAAGGNWCMSSYDCKDGWYCTTETGDCLRPPTCRPNEPCLAVCYGRCEKIKGETCGSVLCDPGLVCCNESCGICTEPDGFCTQQICTEAEQF